MHQLHQVEHQLQVERRGLRVLQPEQLLEAAHLVRVRVRLRGRVRVRVRARVRVRVKLRKAAHPADAVIVLLREVTQQPYHLVRGRVWLGLGLG